MQREPVGAALQSARALFQRTNRWLSVKNRCGPQAKLAGVLRYRKDFASYIVWPIVINSFTVTLMKRQRKHSIVPEEVLSRIIEMAWEDRTPFEAIQENYGVTEADVIRIMRSSLKASSFRLWRKRVTGKKTKHLNLRSSDVKRGYCPTQYKQRSK